MAEQTPDYLAPPLGSSHATTPPLPATAAATSARDRARLRADQADLADAVDRIRGHLGDRDGLGRLGAAALRRRLSLLRRLEGATTAAIANTVAALDRVGGIEADGAPSKAEWLKANTGRSGREAARLQRLADNLDELPGTADALASGDLTAEAADAIVRASRDGRIGPPEDAEAELLPVATSASPEDLRRHIKRRQQAADGAALLREESRQRALRRASMTQGDDGGMWELHARVSNEVGAKLRTAFDAPDAADTPNARRRRPEQRLADALEAMADAVLDGGMTPANGGIARPHISVIVDLDTVAANLGRPGGAGPVAPDDPAWTALAPGQTSWGSLLSPQAIHRLLCDASVSRIVMAGRSQVLDVGRAHRDWTEPQRRAVNARDRGCRGPNCSRPIAWTAIHHVAWWQRDRGRTDVDNGLALCSHCHHLVHDDGWTLDFDPTTATATWTSPAGRTIVTRPRSRTGPDAAACRSSGQAPGADAAPTSGPAPATAGRQESGPAPDPAGRRSSPRAPDGNGDPTSGPVQHAGADQPPAQTLAQAPGVSPHQPRLDDAVAGVGLGGTTRRRP